MTEKTVITYTEPESDEEYKTAMRTLVQAIMTLYSVYNEVSIQDKSTCESTIIMLSDILSAITSILENP